MSLLELELQAEVDKYATALALLTQQRAGAFPGDLHARMFGSLSFLPELDEVSRRRYEEANRHAARYCRSLDERYLHPRRCQPEKWLAELRRFFSDVTPFDYKLTRVSRFPGGTVYVTPEPAAPFRQLTLELTRRFPEHPPYAGAFDDVVPHLSVPLLPDEDVSDVEAELAGRLPVSVRAGEAALYWWEDGACGTLETFPFGTSAA